MEEKKKRDSHIEDMLRKREQIDKSIKDNFNEYVTIMFTDIAGYTSYVETHGDIAAKSLLQQHNDILFALIKEHRGKVVKTIGDAVMASFAEIKDAARTAVAIQCALKEYNSGVDNVKKINIRIGFHAGYALRDGEDYFGDAVNVAARIEPAGQAGQVLMSETVFTFLKDDEEFFCSYFGEKKAKGKSEPLILYRLFLSSEEQQQMEKKKKKQEEKLKADAQFHNLHQQHQAQHKDKKTDQVQDIKFVLEKPVIRYDLMWKSAIPIFIVLLLLFIYPGYIDFFKHPGSDGYLAQYNQAFDLLKAGDFVKAKNLFLTIGKDSSLCNEGLAAIAYKQKSFQEAEQLCDQSIGIKSDILYPRVIKGNIMFDTGKVDQAKKMYQEAVNLTTPLPWQKGEAYFRMGRISSAQKNSDRALKYYNTALSLDDKNPDIMTAKGIILEKIGDLHNAMNAFHNAKNHSIENKMAESFYRRVKLKLSVKDDKEKQERIDLLVTELLKSMKDKKPTLQKDRWTSRPMTLFFVQQPRTGTLSVNEGEDDFFQMELIEHLQNLKAVEIVDREILDKLLVELKLSSTDLADKNTALELGRIVSSRFIGNLKYLGYDGATKVYAQLIETETSSMKVSISGQYGQTTKPGEAAQKIASAMAEKIRTAYSMRGKISNVEKNIITLNIGSRLGVKKGMMFRVYNKNTKTDTVSKKIAGAVKIILVEGEFSKGEILKGMEHIDEQCLVEAVTS